MSLATKVILDKEQIFDHAGELQPAAGSVDPCQARTGRSLAGSVIAPAAAGTASQCG